MVGKKRRTNRQAATEHGLIVEQPPDANVVLIFPFSVSLPIFNVKMLR